MVDSYEIYLKLSPKSLCCFPCLKFNILSRRITLNIKILELLNLVLFLALRQSIFAVPAVRHRFSSLCLKQLSFLSATSFP